MADTYQTKLTVNGRNPGDNTLEVYRTVGTDCTEIAATYRNQHFWLPTGKNWFTRKWISGEDQDDGFKQCVCVRPGYTSIVACEELSDGFRVPEKWIIDVQGLAGDVEYAVDSADFPSGATTRTLTIGTIPQLTLSTTGVGDTWYTGDGSTVTTSEPCTDDVDLLLAGICQEWAVFNFSSRFQVYAKLLRDGLRLYLEVQIGFSLNYPGGPLLLIGAYYDEYTATSVEDGEAWLADEHIFTQSCNLWECAENGVPGSVTGCISSTFELPSEVRIFPV